MRCLHELDSRAEVINNLGSGGWLAWSWTNDTAAHCKERR